MILTSAQIQSYNDEYSILDFSKTFMRSLGLTSTSDISNQCRETYQTEVSSRLFEFDEEPFACRSSKG